jgi:hypothetical protein
MKNNTLTPRQLMLSPNILAYELDQIPTPEKIEIISYNIYQIQQENKSKKLNYV